MLNSKELYDKISVWREEKGWTENKLCDMAGVSHSMFHSWVSRGTMPKLDTLESLCYALDKPLAALLFDVDEKTAAVIMAIVSNESGIPLNRLQFKSIKAIRK